MTPRTSWLDTCRLVALIVASAIVVLSPLVALADCTGSWVSERDSRQGRSQPAPAPTSVVYVTATGTTLYGSDGGLVP